MLKDKENYEDGYDVGYIDGRNDGFSSGYYACVEDYEVRLKKMWAEIQTLNARIDNLNTMLDKFEDAND